MVDFRIEDCTHTIDEETRGLIAELILSWARYDSLVTHWTFRVFGMGPDEGPIILGAMDTKTKLGRIKSLYAHFSKKRSAENVATLLKVHGQHVDVRNAICHKACAGHHRRDPDRIIFANPKAFPQQPGQMMIEMYHIDQFRAAIAFAKKAADEISKIVDAIVGPPEESPERSPAEGE